MGIGPHQIRLLRDRFGSPAICDRRGVSSRARGDLKFWRMFFVAQRSLIRGGLKRLG